MITQISDDFDLEKTAESGQCFRWEKTKTAIGAAQPPAAGAGPAAAGHKGKADGAGSPYTYRIIAGNACLYITALDTGKGLYDLDCTEDQYSAFWHGYFDLDENYRRIRERIDPVKDPFLREAADREKGIRILRQDPWEMLITFIISQNKNIPGIRRCVESLAQTCGDRKTDSRGIPFYSFPTPQQVASLSEEALAECRLGYRCKYVKAAADAVLTEKINLVALQAEDEKTAIASLSVGVKVANCVSLFGLHHVDAFPIDVWVKRILAEQYPDGYPFEQYSPFNGIYQQYMFAYYRHQASQITGTKPVKLPGPSLSKRQRPEMKGNGK